MHLHLPLRRSELLCIHQYERLGKAGLGELPTERTWDEYLAASKAMTEYNEDGTVKVYGGSDYRNAGVPVHEIRACGGIAGKNPLMMQIYADVLGMPISVSRCKQAPALGAAIYAAAAAKEQTGYPDVFAAVENMADRNFTVYTPTEQHQSVYEALYREYCTLHDYFGCGENRVMERLYHQRAKGGNQP